ncbi:MAG TPA: sugar kinase [Caulobacteraceae bacterium]|nr:sugar kinase [Caulobacteraceae bacterium]
MTVSVKKKRIVCFGEPILRVSAPGAELLLQSNRFETAFGGAEMNVAVSLSRLGDEAAVVAVLPDNRLGQAFRDEFRRHGVDVSHVHFGEGRLALYYVNPGALVRPAEVLYDRAGSAFALASGDQIDWEAALADADWLHLSGITPAVGEGPARSALRAVEVAAANGVKISFDGNYRPKLWETAPAGTFQALRRLFESANLLIANHRDVELVLGLNFSKAEDAFASACAAAFDAFPRLERVTCTERYQHNVDHHDLSARLATRTASYASKRYSLPHVVDRIGGGDAFSAGILHALANGRSDEDTLAFGLAAAVIKHSFAGDFNLADEQTVLSVLADDGFQVRR